jgi:hypothetical protein
VQQTTDTFRSLTIDPGVTTGYVKSRLQDGVLTVQPGQAKMTPYAFQFFLELNAKPPTILICEDFELRPGKTEEVIFYSAYIIGVTMAHAEKKKLQLRMQKPAYGMGGYFKSIEKLKERGVYVGGKDYEHGMAAMRHFMQWLTFGPGFRYGQHNPTVELKK